MIAIALIFPNLPGYNIEEFRYISLGFGFLASLGLAPLTRDVAAGIVLAYMRPFAIGDRIEVDGAVGEVSERNVLLTRMRTNRNESITVPNSNLLSGPITNYTRKESCVRYELNVYTQQPGRSEAICSELHANILDAFGTAGVSLAVSVRWPTN